MSSLGRAATKIASRKSRSSLVRGALTFNFFSPLVNASLNYEKMNKKSLLRHLYFRHTVVHLQAIISINRFFNNYKR